MAVSSGSIVGVIVCSLLVLFVLWVFLKGIKRVRHSEVMIIERLGRYKETLKPGLHWVWPIIDSPRLINWRYLNVEYNSHSATVKSVKTDRIDMREHVIDFGRQNVITKDTVMISIDALVYFRITDPRVAVFKVQNLPDAIELLTQATLRQIIAHMTLDDTFSSREEINAELLSKIALDAERWGVSITRVEIFTIDPPRDIKSAMEKQIKSERDRRSLVLRADGEREGAVVMSRGDAARIVLQAEGARVASLTAAKGNARSRMLQAEAEAKSLACMASACDNAGVRSVDYMMALEYLNALSGMGANKDTKAVLLPVDQLDGIAALINSNSKVAKAR